MNFYQIATLVQVDVTFLNLLMNAPVDPSQVALFIEDPSGNVTEIAYNPGPIVRTGVGVYYYQFVPSGPGKWTYKWQGTGAVIATSRDTSFVVKASALIS